MSIEELQAEVERWQPPTLGIVAEEGLEIDEPGIDEIKLQFPNDEEDS